MGEACYVFIYLVNRFLVMVVFSSCIFKLTLHALMFLLLEIIFRASSASQLLRPGQNRNPLEYAGSFGDEI